MRDDVHNESGPSAVASVSSQAKSGDPTQEAGSTDISGIAPDTRRLLPGGAESIMGVELFLLRVNAQGMVHYINTAFARHVGASKEELTNISLARLRRRLSAAMSQVIQPPTGAEGVLETIRDGEHSYAVRVTPVLEGGFDVVMQDVSEQEDYRAKLERYVSPVLLELAEGLTEVDKMHRDLSVVFCDLRGFTKYSESVGPEKTRDLLNAYLEQSIVCLEEHQGTIDKIIGDEVMALFGLHEGSAQQALLLSIISAGDTIGRLRQHYAAAFPGEDLPLCGIGMHHGEVALAAIGSHNRKDVTALGPTVNLASRLCGLARSGEILVTEETMRHALEAAPGGWDIVEGRLNEAPALEGLGGKHLALEPLAEAEAGVVRALVPAGKADFQNGALLFYNLARVSFKGVAEPLSIVSVVAGPNLARLAGVLRMNVGGTSAPVRARRVISTGLGTLASAPRPAGEVWPLVQELAGTIALHARDLSDWVRRDERVWLTLVATVLVLAITVNWWWPSHEQSRSPSLIAGEEAARQASSVLSVFARTRANQMVETFYEEFDSARDAVLLGEVRALPADQRGVAQVRLEKDQAYRDSLVRRGGSRLLAYHLDASQAKLLPDRVWRASALGHAAVELRERIDVELLAELTRGIDATRLVADSLAPAAPSAPTAQPAASETATVAAAESANGPTPDHGNGSSQNALATNDLDPGSHAWRVARSLREYVLERTLQRSRPWPEYVAKPAREAIARRLEAIRLKRAQLAANAEDLSAEVALPAAVILARLDEEAADWRLLDSALQGR